MAARKSSLYPSASFLVRRLFCCENAPVMLRPDSSVDDRSEDLLLLILHGVVTRGQKN
jgi:hypothetical protein